MEAIEQQLKVQRLAKGHLTPVYYHLLSYHLRLCDSSADLLLLIKLRDVPRSSAGGQDVEKTFSPTHCQEVDRLKFNTVYLRTNKDLNCTTACGQQFPFCNVFPLAENGVC